MNLIIFFMILINTIVSITQKTPPPILPEVQAILDVKQINEQEMDQNAYVYLMGIDIAGDNYQTIAKKYLLATNTKLRASINQTPLNTDPYDDLPSYQTINLERTIAGEFYTFPCHNLPNLQCINEVTNTPQLDTLLTANDTLLKRYQSIIQLPFYKGYPETISSKKPAWDKVIFLSTLNQIIAIKLIEQGNIDDGLTILNNEATFYKQLLIGTTSITDNTITGILLLKNYHVTEQLLDLPIMKNQLYNPLLLNLFTPLTTKEQQSISIGLLKDRESFILTSAVMKKSDLAKHYFENDELISTALSLISYNKNKDLNNTYKLLQAPIDEVSTTLPEASTFYLNTINQHPIIPTLSIIELIKTYGFDNIQGGILTEDSKNFYHRRTAYRFYGIPTYLALITVKLEIKQAHIKKQQVPAFLKRLGKKALNPYTQEPFVWDEKQQTLSTDWPDRSPKPPNIGNKAQVYIAFP